MSDGEDPFAEEWRVLVRRYVHEIEDVLLREPIPTVVGIEALLTVLAKTIKAVEEMAPGSRNVLRESCERRLKEFVEVIS